MLVTEDDIGHDNLATSESPVQLYHSLLECSLSAARQHEQWLYRILVALLDRQSVI